MPYKCERCEYSTSRMDKYNNHECFSDSRSIISTTSTVVDARMKDYYESKLSVLNDEYRKLANDNTQLASKLRDVEQECEYRIDRKTQMYNSEITSLETAIKRLRAQISTQSSTQIEEIEEEMKRIFAKQLEDKKTEIQNLKKIIDSRDETITNLERNKHIQDDKTIKMLEAKYEQKTKLIEKRYTDEIKQYQDQLQESKQIKDAELTKQKNSLTSFFKNEIHNLNESHKASLDETTRYNTKQVASLKQSLADSEKKYTSLTKDFSAAKTVNDNLNSALKQSTDRHSLEVENIQKNHKQELSEYKHSVSSLSESNKKYEIQITSLSSQNKSLASENTTLHEKYNSDIAQSERKNSTLKQQIDKIRQDNLKKLEEMESKSLAKLSEQKRTIELLTVKVQDYDHLQGMYNSLEEKFKERQKQYTSVSEKLREQDVIIKKVNSQSGLLSKELYDEKQSHTLALKQLKDISKQFENIKKSFEESKLETINLIQTIDDNDIRYRNRLRLEESSVASLTKSLQDERKHTQTLSKHLEKEIQKSERVPVLISSLDNTTRDLKLTMDKLKSSNDECKKFRKMYEISNTDCIAHSNARTDLQRELESQIQINTALENKMNDVRHTSKRLQSQNIDLEKDKTTLRQQHQVACKERDEISSHHIRNKERIISLETNLSQIKAERDGIRHQNSELKAVNSDFASKLSTSQSDLDKLRIEYDVMLVQFNNTKRKNMEHTAKLGNEIDDAKRQISEISNSYTRVKDKNANLQKELLTFQSIQEEYILIKDINSTLKNTINELEKKLFSQTTDINNKILSFDGKYNALDREKQKLKKEVESLNVDIDNLLKTQKDTQQLETQIQEYKQRILHTESIEKKLLESESKLNESNRKYQKMNAEQASLKTLYAKSLQTMKVYKATEDNYKMFEQKYNEKLIECNTLVDQKENVIRNYNVEKKTKQRVENELNTVKSELKKTTIKLAASVKELTIKEVASLKTIDKLESNIQQLETQLKSSNDAVSHLESLEKERNETEKKLAKYEKEKHHTERQLKSHMDDLAKQTELIEEMKQSYSSLRAELNTHKATATEFSKQLTVSQTKMKTHKTTIDNLNDQISSLKETNSHQEERMIQYRNLTTEFEKQKHEYSKVLAKNTFLAKQNSNLLLSNADTQTRLNDMKEFKEKYKTLDTSYSELLKKFNALDTLFIKISQECEFLRSNTDDDLQRISRKQEAEIKSLSKQLEELKEWNSKLSEDSLAFRKAKGDIKALLEEKEKLTENYSKTKVHITSLQQHIDKLPKRDIIDNLNKTLEYLKEENQTLKNQQKSTTERLKNLARIEKKNTTMKTELDATNKRYRGLVEERNAMKENSLNMKEIIKDLEHRLKDISERLDTTEHQLLTTSEERDRMKNIESVLNNKVKKMRDESLTAIRKYVEKERNTQHSLNQTREELLKIDILMKRQEELLNEIELLKSDKDNMQGIYENRIQEVNEEKEKRIHDLNKMYQHREERIRSLEAQLSLMFNK